MRKTNHQLVFVGKSFGTSMEPLINPGDKLYIQKKVSNFKVGEIILFYQNKKLICHRVIKLLGKWIITKGDNLVFQDNPQKKKSIIGIVRFIKGKNYCIDTQRIVYKMVSLLFTLRILLLQKLPPKLFPFINSLLRGRKLLIKIISQKSLKYYS